MPYLKSTAVETDRLTLPSNGEYYVLMKKRAEYGDSLAAQSAMVKIETNGNGQAKVSEPDSAASVRTLVSRLIVDWNLDDENGQKLPITPEMVDKLDPQDGNFLAEEANKRVGERPDEKAIPFVNTSGRLSTGTQSKTTKRRAS